MKPLAPTWKPVGEVVASPALQQSEKRRTTADGVTDTPTPRKALAIRARLVGSNTCSAAGKTAIGPAPVLALCRQLVAAGLDGNLALEVYRGDTLALFVRSIGKATTLTVRESTRDGRPRLARLSSDGSAPAPKSSWAGTEYRFPWKGARR
jgi:hypothetical protein